MDWEQDWWGSEGCGILLGEGFWIRLDFYLGEVEWDGELVIVVCVRISWVGEGVLELLCGMMGANFPSINSYSIA